MSFFFQNKNSTYDLHTEQNRPSTSMGSYNPYTLSNSSSNIIESHRYDNELRPPMWPKVIINSPVHHERQQIHTMSQQTPQQPPPPSVPDNKFSRFRYTIHGRKISNSCDNILHEDDEVVINNSPTFDLDHIERERRKSHAGLFDTPRHASHIIRHSDDNDDDDGTPV